MSQATVNVIGQDHKSAASASQPPQPLRYIEDAGRVVPLLPHDSLRERMKDPGGPAYDRCKPLTTMKPLSWVQVNKVVVM